MAPVRCRGGMTHVDSRAECGMSGRRQGSPLAFTTPLSPRVPPLRGLSSVAQSVCQMPVAVGYDGTTLAVESTPARQRCDLSNPFGLGPAAATV
jgi:hypothetical protein